MDVSRSMPLILALLALVMGAAPAPAQQPPSPQAQPVPAPPAAPSRPAARPAQATGQAQPAAAQGSPPPAPAGLQILDRGWRVVCQSPANNRNLMQCNVIFEAFRDNGQRLLAIELVREGGETRILLTTPLGVNLLAPVEIAIDRGAPLRAAYQTCQSGGCVALAPRGVDAASLGGAREVEVRFETGGQKIGIPVPMAGFAAAIKRAE